MGNDEKSGAEMISTQSKSTRRPRGSYATNFSVAPSSSAFTRGAKYVHRLPTDASDKGLSAVGLTANSMALDHLMPAKAGNSRHSGTMEPNMSFISLEQSSTLVADELDNPKKSQKSEVEDVLASLPPLQRWSYLARERRSSFVVFALATLAWLYSVMTSWAQIEITAASLFSTAIAQDNQAILKPSSGMFHMQDVLLFLLTIFVVWSLATVTFASSSDKIKHAGDTLKTILGFVVGYFSSGKSA